MDHGSSLSCSAFQTYKTLAQPGRPHQSTNRTKCASLKRFASRNSKLEPHLSFTGSVWAQAERQSQGQGISPNDPTESSLEPRPKWALRGESVAPNASKMWWCLATVFWAWRLAGRWMSKASNTEGRGLAPAPTLRCHVEVEVMVEGWEGRARGPAHVLLLASSFSSCTQRNTEWNTVRPPLRQQSLRK